MINSRLLGVIIVSTVLCAPLVKAAETKAPEYWLSRSKKITAILILNNHGQAEYTYISERSDKTSYFSHDAQATWGERAIPLKLSIPVGPSQKPLKAVRDFWIKTSKYRFDFLEGDGRVFQVDKMGIQQIFEKVENMP